MAEVWEGIDGLVRCVPAGVRWQKYKVVSSNRSTGLKRQGTVG